MFVNRAHPPTPASVNLVLQHGGKPYKVSIALFVDYSYYSRTIRTIRRLFADYSYYSSTIRGLFVLFVDYSHYSHYSLHYSSFINCHWCIVECQLYYNVPMVGIFIHWCFKHRWRAMYSFLVYVFLAAKCCWSWQVAKLTYEWYDPNIGYASQFASSKMYKQDLKNSIWDMKYYV
jgi:hypothetical protein